MLSCWPSEPELSFPAHRHSAESRGFVSGKMKQDEEKFRLARESMRSERFGALALVGLKQCKISEL
jgi:hypothetical protein